MVCNLATPPLSSIALPLEQMGFKAAGLLDRLMRGARPPREPIVLPPMHVVARRSTDLLAIEDADVRKALQFIRDHAERLDRVAEVAAAVAVSKRTLQRDFQAVLGRTVQQEILRCRLERARRILLETDLPIPQVATRCGFTYPHYFGRVFRKAMGLTPSRFRNEHRLR
jgi:LacI family transcriptional regulator